MKSDRPAQLRPYRQGARAAAAEATGVRILEAMLARIQVQWFDEITLDALAQDAGVTVQTVLRRFGGKEALLTAAAEHFGRGVEGRRSATPGDIPRIVQVLASDYESAGDLVWRLLAQEDRHAALKTVTDYGRAEHRRWLARAFAPQLDDLGPKARGARLDALVVATDLYVWKLVRRDMGRSLPAYKALLSTMICAAVTDTGGAPKEDLR